MQRNEITWVRLDPARFDEFLAEHPDWGDSWQQNALCAGKAYLRWLEIEKHPLYAKFIHRRSKRKILRSLSPNEVVKLIKGIDWNTDKGKRDLVLLILACETGLRASEAANLKLRDVDLDDMKIRFKQKGDRLHNPVIPESLLSTIAEWLQVREKRAKPGIDTFFVSLGGIRRGTSMTRQDMV